MTTSLTTRFTKLLSNASNASLPLVAVTTAYWDDNWRSMKASISGLSSTTKTICLLSFDCLPSDLSSEYCSPDASVCNSASIFSISESKVITVSWMIGSVRTKTLASSPGAITRVPRWSSARERERARPIPAPVASFPSSFWLKRTKGWKISSFISSGIMTPSFFVTT